MRFIKAEDTFAVMIIVAAMIFGGLIIGTLVCNHGY